eukprot:525014_1
MLVIYFQSYGRNDYYDENNNGKLIIFLNNNKLDSDAIVEELENRIELSKQKLINFRICIDNDGYNKIYEVIKFYYKYKQLPTPVAIESLSLYLPSNICQYIGNVMKHELYPQILSTFMEITKWNEKKDKTINQMINELQKQNKIDDNELKYIRQLIQRTLIFVYKLNCDNNREHDIDYKQPYPSMENDDISHITNEVNIDILYDIYNVHNCFLFTNFNFEQYATTQFMADIEKNKKMNVINKLQINIQMV